jgi:hypothetical protein
MSRPLNGMGLEDALPKETADAMRMQGLGLDEMFEELGLDAEAMCRDPISTYRRLDGPKPEVKSLEQARRETEPMRARILELYRTLGDIAARHEATIQRRWAKKTKPQRLSILLDVWPDMPRFHRPDFVAYTVGARFAASGAFGAFAMANMKQSWQEHALCPTISQDDLVKPRTLPLLLNSRARNHPSAFAGTDRTELSVGLRAFVLVPYSVPGHVMLLNRINDSNSQEYGRIVLRNQPESSTGTEAPTTTTTTPEKQYSVGEGYLILQTQQKILDFLMNVCRAILHEIPPDAMTGPQFPIQPDPKLKEESQSTGFESLELMALEAPYRLPARLDMDRVVSVLAARASEAKDHLWSLREDPSYFHETLLEYADHRNEILWGNPDGSSGRDVVLWPGVLSSLLTHSYRDVESFEELRKQAVGLQSLQAKYAAEIDPSRDLPSEYMAAIITFRTFLWQIVSTQFSQLWERACSSPNMRHMMRYSERAGSIVTNPQEMGDVEDTLLWLLKALLDDGEDLETLGLTMVVDQLEHFINSKPEAKRLISPLVGRSIGDLSIVAQCYRQLELYQPWAQEFELQAAQRDKKMRRRYFEWKEPSDKITSAFVGGSLEAAGRLANPSGGRFTYPVARRRTKENVERLRQSEANLDAFWRTVDRLVHAKLPGMKGTVAGQFLAQSRLLKRTPEWVEPETPAAEKASSKPSLKDESDQPLSSFYFEFTSGSSTIRRPELPAPKSKVKTKGVAKHPNGADKETTAVTSSEPVQVEHQQPTSMAVDARALKVFRALFFNPDVTSTPGEIPWNDFLHAMASAGFVARKLYGSVWQFCPSATTKLDVEQAIQFHEPHPKPKIAFTTARRIGRRLYRQYGWVGGMFELARQR